MTTEPTIVIRADASAVIGAGHVIRCLALAQAWHDGGGLARLFCSEIPDWLRAVVEEEGIAVDPVGALRGSRGDALTTRDRLEETGAGALVLDGYFDQEYQATVRSGNIPLLVIDDDGQAGGYDADLILDPNPGTDPLRYEARPVDTELLLGAGYALLRREFRNRIRTGKTISLEDHVILITLGGGGEADGLAAMVLRALDRIVPGGIGRAIVVGGGVSGFSAELTEMAARMPVEIELRTHVEDISSLMDRADIVISGGGSTCWELAFMGVPGLTIIRAENQRLIAEELDAAGILLNLGGEAGLSEGKVATAIDALLASPDRRGEMSRKGQALVDGQGASRAIEAIRGVMERG